MKRKRISGYVKKGGHGGHRSGAGRKSSLSKVDRLLIGARCESEWAELAEQIALRKLEDEFIEEARKLLHSIPLAQRKFVGDLGTDAPTEAVADATTELEWINERLGGHRVISFRRPQHQRNALIERIAAEESERHGLTITPHQVRRWWSEYNYFCESRRDPT